MCWDTSAQLCCVCLETGIWQGQTGGEAQQSAKGILWYRLMWWDSAAVPSEGSLHSCCMRGNVYNSVICWVQLSDWRSELRCLSLWSIATSGSSAAESFPPNVNIFMAQLFWVWIYIGYVHFNSTFIFLKVRAVTESDLNTRRNWILAKMYLQPEILLSVP